MQYPISMRFLFALALLGCGGLAFGAQLHVGPKGDDANPGTTEKPLKTLGRARDVVRTMPKGKEAITVTVHEGVYYLPETLVFTAEDSGTADAPVIYAAAAGAQPLISGGLRLDLKWEPHKDGIFKANTPPGLSIDQLFVNGVRQHMARYPNYDAKQRIMGGFAADAFSKERAARWADPAGAFIHAMHRAHWGGYHYRITGKNDKGEVTYEGGWQNNRQMGMHKDHRYVENIFEELDAEGEWYHDAKQNILYYKPHADEKIADAIIEVVRLRHLVEFQGTQQKPVKFIQVRGFMFRLAARTFMDVKEPLLRSDWTIYRGGAVLFNGAEDCVLSGCELDQLGGNGVFVNNYNRRVTIKDTQIEGAGGNGICFVGDPKSVRNPLFEYGQRQSFEQIDKTPGPQTDNYPADCVVDNCLITRTGRVEKQTAGVQISMSMGITVRHCSIYEVPRAGINISEGTFGGHIIEFCDGFDTVLETGDHGSFNSWGRDRFWGLKNAPADQLPKLALLDVVKPNIIRNSRWRCDHGWDIDLDDGSSNYEIYNNLMLGGGLKLREGFHRKVWNNITVNNTFHPHVWYDNCGDTVTGNIFMGAHRPAGGMPKGKWGAEIDRNLFTTSDADRTKFARNGCDANSLVGDALFVDPAKGDYTVKEGSPALKLGFKNFPMTEFGVKRGTFKVPVRSPELPKLRQQGGAPVNAPTYAWRGAVVRQLVGEEYSAHGVAKDAGGVLIAELPGHGQATVDGLREGDLILSVNGKPARTMADLQTLLKDAGDKGVELSVRRDQKDRTVKMAGKVDGPTRK